MNLCTLCGGLVPASESADHCAGHDAALLVIALNTLIAEWRRKGFEICADQLQECVTEVMVHCDQTSARAIEANLAWHTCEESSECSACDARPTELRTIEHLQSQNAALKRDAERYRWLRDKSEKTQCGFYLSVGEALANIRVQPQTVDNSIDAAMALAHPSEPA